MIWVAGAFIAGFIFGLLVGRKNPAVANVAAAGANAVKDAAEKVAPK